MKPGHWEQRLDPQHVAEDRKRADAQGFDADAYAEIAIGISEAWRDARAPARWQAAVWRRVDETDHLDPLVDAATAAIAAGRVAREGSIATDFEPPGSSDSNGAPPVRLGVWINASRRAAKTDSTEFDPRQHAQSKILTVVLTAAATIVCAVVLSTDGRVRPSPLPAYGLEMSHTRSANSSTELHLDGSDASFRVLLRPTTRADGEIRIRAEFRSGRRVVSWTPETRIHNGTVSIIGTAAALPIDPGEWTLVIWIGRPDGTGGSTDLRSVTGRVTLAR